MSRPNLNERQRRILKFVVESHVMRAEPVGSQYVRMAYHLSISPATIRGAMKRLEDEGLLDHPHTSAGRVPTEAGYRYYVDILMEPEPISPATKRALERKLGRSPRDGGGGVALEDLQKEAADALAQLSGQLAMVALGSWSEIPIRHMRIGGAENIAA
jgi:heat-inducible transcriptional repressor